MECSCPDWGVPCKHLAATFYLLAEAFDADPFQILHWRGRDRETLLAQPAHAARRGAAEATALDRAPTASPRRAADRGDRCRAALPDMASPGPRPRPGPVLGAAGAAAGPAAHPASPTSTWCCASSRARPALGGPNWPSLRGLYAAFRPCALNRLTGQCRTSTPQLDRSSPPISTSQPTGERRSADAADEGGAAVEDPGLAGDPARLVGEQERHRAGRRPPARRAARPGSARRPPPRAPRTGPGRTCVFTTAGATALTRTSGAELDRELLGEVAAAPPCSCRRCRGRAPGAAPRPRRR